MIETFSSLRINFPIPIFSHLVGNDVKTIKRVRSIYLSEEIKLHSKIFIGMKFYCSPSTWSMQLKKLSINQQ